MLGLKSNRNLKLDNYKNIIILGSIFIGAALLRLYGLGKYAFSYDEAITIMNGGHKISRTLYLFGAFDTELLVRYKDILMFFFEDFIYFWQRVFGGSETILRLTSVIFSLSSIYLLFVLAKEVFNRKVAYIAVLLAAISPFSILYSQELRPYSAVSFLTLLVIYSLLKFTETGKIRYGIVYVVGNVISIYFHYMSLLVLWACFLFQVFNIKKYKHIFKKIVIIYFLIASLLLPLLLTCFANARFIFNNFIDSEFSEFPIWAGKITFSQVLFTLKNFSIGYNTDFFSGLGLLSFAIYGLFFLTGVFKVFSNPRARLLGVCFFVPILTLFFLSKLKPCYVDRYLFSVFYLYILFIAVGLSRIKNRFLFTFLIVLLVSFNFCGLRNYYFYHLPTDEKQHIAVSIKPEIKGLTATLVANYDQGDGIVNTCKNTIFPLKAYIKHFTSDKNLID
ncbi:MAG: glycosyltransferase family 39 protein, partial [Candidatus Omnitrophota bacterium]